MLSSYSYLPIFNPPNLSGITSITMSRTGTNGKIYLYAEHKNAALVTWHSLVDVLNEMTLIGELPNGVPLSFPVFPAGASEQVRFVLRFLRDTQAVPVDLPVSLNFIYTQTSDVPEVIPVEDIAVVEQTHAYITLKWKDDDKPDTTNERVIDCGVVGDTNCFRSERRMGVYRGRQYTIRLTDPRPVVIIAAEEEVEVMPW